jgi:hypothetical protein
MASESEDKWLRSDEVIVPSAKRFCRGRSPFSAQFHIVTPDQSRKSRAGGVMVREWNRVRVPTKFVKVGTVRLRCPRRVVAAQREPSIIAVAVVPAATTRPATPRRSVPTFKPKCCRLQSHRLCPGPHAGCPALHTDKQHLRPRWLRGRRCVRGFWKRPSN